MKIEELKAKHEYHKTFESDWERYGIIQESGDALVSYALHKYERETTKNYEERVRAGIVFNLGKRIIEIFNFYLNEKETIYNIEKLKNDTLWQLFKKDADLAGTDYHSLMIEARKWASYYGSIGILVNKPSNPGRTRKYEIDNGIYPYCTLYSLPNIHDWRWKKNRETHRWELSYLKLYEGDNIWTVWGQDKWEQWAIEEVSKVAKPKLVDSGDNPLGEIPFLWMLNIRNLKCPEVGVSDIIDIAPITFSIARNLSSADEIIKFAGFPILRHPMKRVDLGGGTVSGGRGNIENYDIDDQGAAGEGTIAVGESAVLEFDPSLGEAGKPDWMPTQILEPIEAILKMIDRKTEEAYAAAYLSGVRSQKLSGSGSGQASGLALRYELSQLKSVLVSKSINSIEAEYQIVRLWLKWLGEKVVFDDKNEIKQSHEFSIDEMAVALENAIESFGMVNSKTFRERIQKKIAFSALPDLPQDDKNAIINEIAANTPDKIDMTTMVTNRAIVKPGNKTPDGGE